MPERLVPPPLALCLIACEKVITDGRTGQVSLIGVLNQIHALQFPVIVPELCVYAELTNGRGAVPLKVRITDANELRAPVLEADVETSMENPLAISHVAFGSHGLVFPERGEYRVQLFSDGALLLERRLMFLMARTAPAEPGS